LALLGAGLYAGYRWLARAARDMAATLQRAEGELRQPSEGPREKNLGTLKYDPASGVYRPVKPE
jgi:hypothetical protein